MITGTITIGMFFITCIIALLEPYMGKFKWPVYISLGGVLIFVAALREVGVDPDSINYEYSFLHYDTPSNNIMESVEPTFTWFSAFLSFFTNDVHALFFVYAALGLSLKFIAFRRLTEFWFLPVVVYISYYFIAHEMMQIRTAVLSGILLLAVSYQVQGRKLMALLLIAIGTMFHYSAFLLLPMLFMSSDYMSLKRRLIWTAAIPASYVIYFLGLSILMSLDIPLVGAKLASYQSGTEKGTVDSFVNVFRPLHLFTIMMFAYLMYFYDTIVENNKHFTLLLKLFIIGICGYEVFGFLPVLAQRVNQLFLVSTIPLFTCIYYTIRPKWAGILVVIIVSFVYLNYALPFISTQLFWNGQ